MTLKTKINKSYLRVYGKHNNNKIDLRLSYQQWAVLYAFPKWQEKDFYNKKNHYSAVEEMPVTIGHDRNGYGYAISSSLGRKDLLKQETVKLAKGGPFVYLPKGWLLTDLGKEVISVLPRPRKKPSKVVEGKEISEVPSNEVSYCSTKKQEISCNNEEVELPSKEQLNLLKDIFSRHYCSHSYRTGISGCEEKHTDVYDTGTLVKMSFYSDYYNDLKILRDNDLVFIRFDERYNQVYVGLTEEGFALASL